MDEEISKAKAEGRSPPSKGGEQLKLRRKIASEHLTKETDDILSEVAIGVEEDLDEQKRRAALMKAPCRTPQEFLE